MVPGTPFDSARVEALLEARGAKALPSGGRAWQLEYGAVELHPLREGGQWVATEVRVPLSDRTDLVREVVSRVAEVAKEAEVRLFDPQLGRALSAQDDGLVSEQYERTARYAGETLGMVEALPISTVTESEGFQPTTKFFFGVLGFFVLLYLVMDWIGGSLGG
jgi:hypothetical protein